MTKELLVFAGLSVAAGFGMAQDLPQALHSIETGYTISKIRTAQEGSTSFIVASSYEGTLLGIDYDGITRWTNELSGFMNRDVWCDDLTGDGVDEILTANADGTIYCLDADGLLQWQFKTNDAPMNAVCVVRDTGNTPYVVCGGYDLNIYYLSAAGELVKTIASSTYSIDQAWSGTLPNGPTGFKHTANFLRPAQVNGKEILVVQGVLNTHQDSGSIYLFDVMEDQPFRSDNVFGRMRVGDLRAIDPDQNGTDEILMGASVNRDAGRIIRYDPLTGAETEFDIFGYKAFNRIAGKGYRVAQTVTIPDGTGGYQYFLLYGDTIMLLPPDLDPANSSILSTRHAFNDLWQDPATGILILGSAQSGGSCIHILDPLHANWKTDYENLTPPGKIATILSNTSTARAQLASFTKPTWEREQTPVYMTEEIGGLEPLANHIMDTYDSPFFLKSYFNQKVQSADWRDGAIIDFYAEKRNRLKQYVFSPQEALDDIEKKSRGFQGISMRAGHTTDPYFYEPSTYLSIIDERKDDTTGEYDKTILVWSEVNGSSPNFPYVIDNLFAPVADYASSRNAVINLHNKNTFWLSRVYLPEWDRIVSGEFSNVFVPAMEETSDKTHDMTIAGRMGLWTSGAVDSWGFRAVSDNPSYDRLRQFSTQRLPNHHLRMIVYRLSSGAQYMDNFAVDQEYLSIFWELIAKGALFVPRTHEIVSINPVHLGMANPDHDFIDRAENNKWTTFWDESWEETNKMVFNRMNGTWPGAPIPEWDFSRYATGIEERRLAFLPPYPKGLVMVAPPQKGVFADTDAPRGAIVDHLHPMYKNIIQEFITDGRHYYSADGTLQHNAETYFQVIENAITDGAKKLPVTVSGDVAWVCAQTSPTHLRLTLIDSGYINPKERTATVSFNTVTPIAVTDLLDGSNYSVSDPSSVDIDVPLGLFRFIDIELDAPFYTENGWTRFASEHGLSGTSDADADNDGQSDILEYAFGGNPIDPSSKAKFPIIEHNSNSRYSFSIWKRDHTYPGISYTTEWTDDLSSNVWNHAWDAKNESLTNTPGYIQIKHQIQSLANKPVFFRLRITQP